MTSEQKLEATYPAIEWREPVMVGLLGERAARYGCRFCIALKGLKGSQVKDMRVTRQEFINHMKGAHGL